MSNNTNSTYYTVGGTVQAGNGLYISRRADEELLGLCREGAFAYVLAPRQLGKSSLMIQTAECLQQEGILSVIVDLTQLGVQVKAEEWYLGLLTVLEDNLLLDIDVVSWWQEHAHLSNIQRLVMFFQALVQTKLQQRLVVFVDEIDSTLSLDFTDDFYAAIRSLYVARARMSELKRLSFVLVGVATPGDLIRDPKRTPFNIGQRVDMTDFSLEEALPLARGLAEEEQAQKQALGWVFKWTGGHPYLTQRLCRLLAERPDTTLTEARIDQVVTDSFFGEKSFQDNNLQFVRDMLTRRSDSLEEVLSIYRQVRRGKPKILDEEQSLVKSHLKLSGIVRTEGTALKVRNQIYRKVFNEKWIKEHLPVNWAGQLRRAFGLIVVSLAISLLMGLLSLYAFIQQNLANQRASEAETARAASERQRQTSEVQTLAFRSQTILDPELRLLLAREAVERLQKWQLPDINGQAENALRQALRTYTPNRALRGHSSRVTSAIFSPDGQQIASLSQDGILNLWETATGKKVLTLGEAGQQSASGVSFSPDGKRLVAGLDDTLVIWSLPQGQILFRIKICCNGLVDLGLSPDGQRVAVGMGDFTVHVLSTQTGQELGILRGHQGQLSSVSFSPDGTTLLTSSYDNSAFIWDAQTYQPRSLLGDVGTIVWGSVFSPDGKLVATLSVGGMVKVWEVVSGKLLKTLSGHTGAVNGASFSADNQYLATASDDTTARLWQLSTGQNLLTLHGHSAAVTDVIFSPDEKRLVTSSKDGTARVWAVSSGQELGVLYGHTAAISRSNTHRKLKFSPDGKYLLTAGEDGTVRLWEWSVVNQQPVSELTNHNSSVNSLVFSPDGKYLLSGSSDSSVRMWEATTGQVLLALPLHTGAVYSAVFSKQGDFILTSDLVPNLGGRVTYLETSNGWSKGEVKVRYGSGLKELSAVPSPDGKVLAVYRSYSSSDRKTELWELANSDQPRVTLEGSVELGPAGPVFSPDGRRIITVGTGPQSEATIWEVASGQPLVRLKGHVLPVNQAAFNSTGKRVVTASDDSTARVWDAESGKLLLTLQGHTAGVNTAIFSRDDRFILTGGQDGTARVWDGITGQEVISFHTPGFPVRMAVFSPDAHLIGITGEYAGNFSSSIGLTPQVYACEICKALPNLLELAKKQVPRELTQEERNLFGL